MLKIKLENCDSWFDYDTIKYLDNIIISGDSYTFYETDKNNIILFKVFLSKKSDKLCSWVKPDKEEMEIYTKNSISIKEYNFPEEDKI